MDRQTSPLPYYMSAQSSMAIFLFLPLLASHPVIVIFDDCTQNRPQQLVLSFMVMRKRCYQTYSYSYGSYLLVDSTGHLDETPRLISRVFADKKGKWLTESVDSVRFPGKLEISKTGQSEWHKKAIEILDHVKPCFVQFYHM